MNGWRFTEDVYVCSRCRDKLGIDGFQAENRIGRLFWKSCNLCGRSNDDLHLIDYKKVNAALAWTMKLAEEQTRVYTLIEAIKRLTAAAENVIKKTECRDVISETDLAWLKREVKRALESTNG